MDDFVITGPVMALIEVSTAYEYAVGAINKPIHKENRVYTAGAHYPDHPHLWRVLEAGHTCCISCGIAAPVAEEAENLGFGFIVCHSTLSESFHISQLTFLIWHL